MKDIFGQPQKKKKKQTEGQLQSVICRYIRLKYPHVIFISDLSSGMKLPPHIAKRNAEMKSGRGLPDMLILHSAKKGNTIYSGLAIELKAEGNSPFLKNGVTLSSNEHIQEQAEILNRLRVEGWFAAFAVGYTQATQIIDNYLK